MTNNGRVCIGSPARWSQPRVGILLPQRLASTSPSLDLTALQEWLQATLPSIQVEVGPDPARHPGEIGRMAAASGAQRLVLGLASGEYPVAEIQTHARKGGLDPAGIGVVNLGAGVASFDRPAVAIERAKLLLVAAIARARVFAGSHPQHLKTSLALAVSRRALFTLAAHEYQPVPAVLAGRCAAERGCRHCVDVCPRSALRLKDQRVELDKTRCEGCGLCLTACPWDAIEYPGNSFAELDAEVDALLDPAFGDLAPRAILLGCRRSLAALDKWVERGLQRPAGWLPVAAPCVGMLSPAFFLRCLAAGASAVAVVPCSGACPFDQDAVVAERVGFCRDLLELMGTEPDRVTLLQLTPDAPPLWSFPASSAETAAASPTSAFPFGSSREPRAAAIAIRRLAAAYQAPADLTLAHAQSPLGVVDLDASGCTGCEACVTICPTGALASEHRDNALTLTFDAARCLPCGLCVARCPEGDRGVLRLHHVADLGRLRAGRTSLYRDQTLRCQNCGGPIASSAMMTRVAKLLGDQYTAIAGQITQYCPNCRGIPFSAQ